jgi:signal transduction histidine kinase
VNPSTKDSLPPTPRSWLRLPRRTARMRLTLLYGGLFLVCGAALLAITYELVRGGAMERADVPSQGIQFSSPLHHPGAKLPTRTLPHLPSDHLAALQKKVDLSHQLLWSALALAIMAVISLGLGYYVAGRLLRPVRSITRTARAISARNLSERLALNGPDDEFKELGDTLDELLARLQAAFGAQRHFVANASHELRTPLSWERSLVEVALADPDPTIESFRRMCDELLLANDQQQRLIDGLLTLASSESGVDHREPLDLARLTGRALLRPWDESDRSDLEITATLQPAPTAGDPRLIERLITNLIENAIHHNIPRGHVAITTGTRERHGFLTVTNSGAVIPADEVERVFEPFQRLNGSRTGQEDGHGLGLSIVKAIATAHNATLTAQPRHAGGLAVEVIFPTDLPDPEEDQLRALTGPSTAEFALNRARSVTPRS